MSPTEKRQRAIQCELERLFSSENSGLSGLLYNEFMELLSTENLGILFSGIYFVFRKFGVGKRVEALRCVVGDAIL